eukprot:3422211-Alexandrium_andersonii.AAC.1
MADRGTQAGETPSCCVSGRPVSHSWLELPASRRWPKANSRATPLSCGNNPRPSEHQADARCSPQA